MHSAASTTTGRSHAAAEHADAVSAAGFAVPAQGRQPWLRRQILLAWACLLLGAAFFLLKTFPGLHAQPDDFANIYAGSYCMAHNCSPYEKASVEQVLVQHGYNKLGTENRWSEHLPLYPVYTLALTLPLGQMPYSIAALVFYAAGALAWALALFTALIANPRMAAVAPVFRAIAAALAINMPDLRSAIGYGNPAALATALLLYCCFDESPRRRWLRAAAYTAALLLKPQMAILFLLPLLFKAADGWRTLVRIAAILAPVLLGVTIWCAAHPALAGWAGQLHANLALGTSANNSMNVSERRNIVDTRLNLSYLFGYWCPNAKLDTFVAYAIVAAMLAVLLWSCWRLAPRRPQWSAWLPLAATSAITLLATYHRYYDAILLLIAVPWAVLAIARATHRLTAWATLLLILTISVSWMRHLPARITGGEGIEQPASVLGFFTHRLNAMLVPLIAVLLLAALVREALKVSNHAGSSSRSIGPAKAS